MKKMIYFSARSRLQPISVSRHFWILSLLLSSIVHSQSVIWKSAERRLSYDFDDYPQDSGGPHGHYDSYGDWIGANGKHEPQLHAAIPFPTLASRMTGELPFARFPDSQAGSELGILGNAGLMPNPPCYHATLNHRAIWATLPSPAPAIKLIKRSAIKIEKRSGTNYPTEKVKIEIIEFVIPKGFIVSKPYDLVASFQGGGSAGGNNSYSENVSAVLLPVEVVELSPKTKDDNDVEIAGSEKPSTSTPLTPFVELNPVADKIAHRELKVRIGEALKGKTVTWTLEPVPGATPATIRGAWTNSTTHPNRFEASAAYGANGFTSLSQASGRTTVANDGFTAIRVNVPPVAYNKVRIRIEIEGVATSINLIDMEVPAIVVIDPGHGGDPSGPKVGGSDPEHALCPKPPAGSGSSERVMTLEFGLLLRDRLLTLRTRDHLNLRFCMTRTADVNSSLAARANIARDRGADVLISFHFNDNMPNTGPRGTETYYDSTGNFNQAEDEGLAGRVNAAVFGAISASDAAARNRGVKGQGLDVLSDPSLGNNENYHPIRAVLLETEFIDVLAVDQLLNTNGNHQQVRQAIIDALGDALQDDLLHNPQ